LIIIIYAVLEMSCGDEPIRGMACLNLSDQ
jgi:hypothetical protein